MTQSSPPDLPKASEATRARLVIIGNDAMMKTRDRDKAGTKGCRRRIQRMFEYLRTSAPVPIVAPGLTISSEEVDRLRESVIEGQRWSCEATCGLCRLHGLTPPK